MYIKNPSHIPTSIPIYKTSKKISDYLQQIKHIPILSQNKNIYIFSKTKELDEAISNLPFSLRVYLIEQ